MRKNDDIKSAVKYLESILDCKLVQAFPDQYQYQNIVNLITDIYYLKIKLLKSDKEEYRKIG